MSQGGGFEPQRKSNYALLLYNVGDLDTLTLSLKSTEVPEVEFTEGTVRYFNQTVKYAAGVSSFKDVPIVFHDYVDRATFQQLAAWVNLVWSPTSGALGWASSYKRSGEIYLLPPGVPGGVPGAVYAGQAFNNRVWVMRGIFPKAFKHEPLDHEDDGSKPLQINLTLSVDSAFPMSMN